MVTSNLAVTIHTFFSALRYFFTVLLFVCITHATAVAQSNEERPTEQQPQYLASIFERDADPEKTTQAFYGALERLRAEFEKNEAILKQAYFDIIDILPPEKQKAWQDLQTHFEKVDFLREFWLGNDFTPATIVNERLIEHYKRLRHARMFYGWVKPKGYDDRGMVYIKYGEPDNYVEDVMNSGAFPMTSWVYYHFGGAISFDFIDQGFGHTLNSDLFVATRATGPKAEALGVLSLLERRIALSPDYARLYVELDLIYRENSSDPFRIRSQFTARVNQHVVEVERSHSQLPPAATDVLAEVKDLPCALSLAKFRGADSTLDLVASYGFRPADLKSKQDTIDVWLKTALRAGNREILQRTDAPQRFLRTDALAEQDFLRTESFNLLPSEYYFAIEIDHPVGKQKGLLDYAITLGQYPEDEMSLSSVVFATHVEPTSDTPDDPATFVRNDFAITPFPYTTFARDLPLFVYFEIYELSKYDGGGTYFEIEYKVQTPGKTGLGAFLASLNPFAGKASSIAFSDIRRGTGTSEPTYLQIDLRQLKPDKYEFILSVTDKISGMSKERLVEFEVGE